jgi:hypothetical protein
VHPDPPLAALGSSVRTGRSLAASVFLPALMAGCALLSGLGFDRARPEDTVVTVRFTPPPDRVAAARVGPARPARPWLDVASWYGPWHHGRPTASGEVYDMEAFTAAHPSLPLGTCLEVVHLANRRRVFVRINDRGPYYPGRTIDLSYRAAQELDMVDDGVARVKVRRANVEACESAET